MESLTIGIIAVIFLVLAFIAVGIVSYLVKHKAKKSAFIYTSLAAVIFIILFLVFIIMYWVEIKKEDNAIDNN